MSREESVTNSRRRRSSSRRKSFSSASLRAEEVHNNLEDMKELAQQMSTDDILTTDVQHPSLLRAIPLTHLLAGFGLQFKARNLAAQSFTEEESKVMYAMSREVELIDNFVSHCWRSSRMGKVLALYMWSNVLGATVVSSLVAAGAAVMQVRGMLPVHKSERFGDFAPYCYFAGTLSFYITFFYWHVVVDYIGCGRGYFFDKLCVHQYIKDRQMAGILLFAAFVSKSKEFVLLWDHLHFTRLWCTLEVASLVKAHGDGRIPLVFLPIDLASLAFVGFTSFAFVLGAVDINFLLDGIIPIDVLQSVLAIFALYGCFKFSRRYMFQRRTLSSQLAHFKVAEAQCFLERDRAIVNKTLVHWFGSLEAFDEHVHTKIKDKIISTVGAELHYPLRYLWPLFPLRLFFIMDQICSGSLARVVSNGDSAVSYLVTIVCYAILLLTWFPIVLAISNLKAEKLEHVWKDRAVNVAMSICFIVYIQAHIFSCRYVTISPAYVSLLFLAFCLLWAAWWLKGSLTGLCRKCLGEENLPASGLKDFDDHPEDGCLEDTSTVV